MRVVLDACLPRRLGRALAGHDVQSVHDLEWSDFDDGPLLAALGGVCDAFVTTDRALVHQQSLRERPFATVLLRARSNRLADLLPLAPLLLAVLRDAQPGQVYTVDGDGRD